LLDKTEEKKLARLKSRAAEEVKALIAKNIDVENITILNAEKFATLEKELEAKRVEENKVIDEKTAADKLEADKKIADKQLEAQKLIDEAKLNLAQKLEASKVSITDKALGIFGMLASKNKKLQKAAIIAEGAVALGRTAVNTSAGNAAALALGIAQAGPVAGPAIAAPAITANTVSGALSGVSIIASTATALKSLGGGGGALSQSGGASVRGGTAASTPQVDFQASRENQIGNTVASNLNTQRPIQAFVVSKDITDQQQLDNNRINSNSI
jgi:hypothetical protein